MLTAPPAEPGLRFGFDIEHPADYLEMLPFIEAAQRRGHRTIIFSRDKDCLLALIEASGLYHQMLTRRRPGLLRLAVEFVVRSIRLAVAARDYRLDRLFSGCGPAAAVAGRLARIPTTLIHDNETAGWLNRFAYRLCTDYITPAAFPFIFGQRHTTFRGLGAFAYLHPKRFKPNRGILESYGLTANDRIVVLRFVEWNAIHDIKLTGLSADQIATLIFGLSKASKLVISSERALPRDVMQSAIVPRIEDFHHILAFASVYAGESATVAYEAAVLGTPAIYISPRRRYLADALARDWGLVEWLEPKEIGDIQRRINGFLDAGSRELQKARHASFLASCENLTDLLVERYLPKGPGPRCSSTSDGGAQAKVGGRG